MKYIAPLNNFKIFLSLLLTIALFSCSDDNELFLAAIEEDIQQNEADEDNTDTKDDSDNDGTDENDGTDDSGGDEDGTDDGDNGNGNGNQDPVDPVIPDVTAPFTVDAGNDIPLTPSNPNRIIYVAVDGSSQNDGLSASSPKDIDSAFDPSFVKAGDVFYIKAGEYNYGTNPSGNAHYDLSNLPCSPSQPCYWIGYKNSAGDINAGQYATVSWEDYKSGSRNSDGTHDLNSSEMPTFSGSKGSGKYIDNESLFYCDGGEQGFVFRNLQIQYFRRGFEFRILSNSVFENVVQANHGWFTEVEGQGGSNSDLQGTGWMIYSSSTNSWGSNNVILNCAAYNMAFRGFTINNSRNTLVAYSESSSDIDNGNPQDYYFHTIGKNNLFTNLRVNRLISSNHSGHGICFNQLSKNNVMQHSDVYGTNVHFDGAIECYAKDIAIMGVNSYGLFKGGGINVMDGAEYNLIENCTLENGGSGVSFSDSGKNPYDEHAGQNNTFRNVTISNKSSSIINLNWWNEVDDLSSNNSFQNCSFKDSPNLFVIARTNSNFSIIDSEITNVSQLEKLDDRKGVFTLNSNTQFLNSNFWNSEVPSKDNYQVEGVTNNPPSE
ncbi:MULTISPECIES: hypothetical protein [Flavobacteriaceae]|uniref:hypothetical protein n=1 Tax=Flavobacteriaceae TaxID=49546 RepID=UPI001491FB21|nr:MULTISPECIES: hypothetical protein [Allomuricauda]MDC6366870.1 hypothetical protein [Muricauda sp. AC10]